MREITKDEVIEVIKQKKSGSNAKSIAIYGDANALNEIITDSNIKRHKSQKATGDWIKHKGDKIIGIHILEYNSELGYQLVRVKTPKRKCMCDVYMIK